MNFKQTLVTIDQGIEKFEALLLFFICLALGFSGLFAVTMRNLADTGFVGLSLLERHAIVWIALIGASLATRQGSHLAIDILAKSLSGGALVLQRRACSFISACFNLVLIYIAWSFLKIDFLLETELTYGIKLWHVQLILPIGLSISFIRYLFQALGLLPLMQEEAQP